MATSAPPGPAAEAAASTLAAGRRPIFYYGYWLVGVALLAQFVSAGTQTYVAGVFMVPMTDDLGWTRSDWTLAQTLGHFIMAGVGLFVGSYVDRNGGRTLMVAGVTVLGAGLFLTSAVTELWQWVLLRGVMFAVGAAMIGNLVVNVTISKWFVERRGQAIGIAAVGVSLGGVILSPVMTPIVDEFGWRVGWQVLAVMAWTLIYPASLLMRRRPEDHGLNPDGKSDEEMASSGGDRARADFASSLTRGEALRTPTFYMIVVAFGLAGVGLFVMLLHTMPFLTDSGYSRTTAALMLTLLAFPAAISKPIWGALMDYVAPKLLASVSFVMTAVAMLIIVTSARAGTTPTLAGGYLLLGWGIGGQIPIQEMIWASYFGRRYLGAVRSVAMPFALVLAAGGPYVVSLYFDKVGDYDGAFFAIGVLWIVGAALVLLVRRPKLPSRLPDIETEGRSPPARGPDGAGGTDDGQGPQQPPPAAPLAAAPASDVANGDGDDVAIPAPAADAVPPVEPVEPPAVAPASGAPGGADAERPKIPRRDYMSGGR